MRDVRAPLQVEIDSSRRTDSTGARIKPLAQPRVVRGANLGDDLDEIISGAAPSLPHAVVDRLDEEKHDDGADDQRDDVHHDETNFSVRPAVREAVDLSTDDAAHDQYAQRARADRAPSRRVVRPGLNEEARMEGAPVQAAHA